MADKIKKILDKLKSSERAQVKLLMMRIEAGDLDGMDIKRLTGSDTLFRVRKGSLRIIYSSNEKENIIVAVRHRHENTYKDL